MQRLLKNTFELQRGGGENLSPMEGLRGAAILLIVVGHVVTLLYPWWERTFLTLNFTDGIFTLMHSAVDLFFAISGYVTYRSLIRKPQPFWPYFKRRLQRIYPVYLAVFGLYLLLSILFPAQNKLPAGVLPITIYLLKNLLLLPGILNEVPLISVSWILSYEMLAYLFIPLLIHAARLRQRSPQQRILISLGLIALGLALYMKFGGPLRLANFLVGMILYDVMELRQHSPLPRGSGLLALLLFPFIIIELGLSPAGMAGRVLTNLLLLGILLYDCFTQPTGLSGKVFSWLPLRWSGNISYSLFLAHGMTLQGLRLILNRGLPITGEQPLVFWLGAPVGVMLSLLPAIALYIFVERPLSMNLPLPWKMDIPADIPMTR